MESSTIVGKPLKAIQREEKKGSNMQEMSKLDSLFALFFSILIHLAPALWMSGSALLFMLLALCFLGFHPALLLVGINPGIIGGYVKRVNLFSEASAFTVTRLCTAASSHP